VFRILTVAVALLAALSLLPPSALADVEPEFHTLSYDGNGAVSGTPPEPFLAYRDGSGKYPVEIADNTGNLKRPGYAFSGWSPHAETGRICLPGETQYIITDDVTLYAVWTLTAVDGIPGVFVEGLDALYQTFIDEDVDLVFSAAGSGEVDGESKDALRLEAAEDDFVIFDYYELSLVKLGADGSNVLHDLGAFFLTVTIPLSEDIIPENIETIYSLHGGVVLEITSEDNGGEYFAVSDGKLILRLNKFSAFAVAVSNAVIIDAAAAANGMINPSGYVPVTLGGSKQFTITPNNGYYISDVAVDGDSLGALNAYTFEHVSDAHTITATFARSGGSGVAVPSDPPEPPETQEPEETPASVEVGAIVTRGEQDSPPADPNASAPPAPAPSDPFDLPIPAAPKVPAPTAPPATETPSPAAAEPTAREPAETEPPAVGAIDTPPPPTPPSGGIAPGVISAGSPLLIINGAPEAWSPLNLILTAAALLAPITLAIIFRRAHGKPGKRQNAFTVLGVILGVLSCAAFLFFEKLNQPAVLADRWTPVFITLFSLSALFFFFRLILSRRSGRE
jgi:hypothetical protein